MLIVIPLVVLETSANGEPTRFPVLFPQNAGDLGEGIFAYSVLLSVFTTKDAVGLLLGSSGTDRRLKLTHTSSLGLEWKNPEGPNPTSLSLALF